MFENLDIIKDLERQRLEITKIETQMCEPLLSDVSHIPLIWDEVKKQNLKNKIEERQIFIMLVLLFYSPKKLVVGSKIRKRVMAALCKATGCKQSLLSHNSENLIFIYQRYNSFHEKFEKLTKDVVEALVLKGIDRHKIKEYLWRYNHES